MRCSNCRQRVVGFLEFGDLEPLRVLFRRVCPHCGCRIRPSGGLICGTIAVVGVVHLGIVAGWMFADQWGIVDDFSRLLFCCGLTLPVMVPLAYAVWRTGWFVAKDREP